MGTVYPHIIKIPCREWGSSPVPAINREISHIGRGIFAGRSAYQAIDLGLWSASSVNVDRSDRSSAANFWVPVSKFIADKHLDPLGV